MLTRLERTHKRFRTDNFSRLLSPALELLESIPPLESGSNRPLDFDFEDQLKTLVHHHLEGRVSDRIFLLTTAWIAIGLDRHL